MDSDETGGKRRLRDQLDHHHQTGQMRTSGLQGFVGRRLRASRHLHQTFDRVTVPGVIDHTLVFHIGGGPATRFEGSRQTGRAERLRSTTLMPANATYGWELPEESDVLHLYIDDDDLRRFALQEFDLDPAKLQMHDHMAVDDPFMRTLTTLVLQELQSDLPQSHLLLEGFDHIVAGHMLRAYSNAADLVTTRRDSELSHRDAAAVARVREIILDDLSENLSVDQLAQAVGLSPYRLMRCFKAEMGVTIHRFVIENRVALVRERIRTSDDSLAEIAFDAGFANQSHMTSAYTTAMGIPPGRHRRQMRK